MRKIAQMGDPLAVGISLICTVHCFLAPVLMTMLPSLKALSITDDASFHFWMMVGILPTSLITLAMGCRKHKKHTFLLIGLVGLLVLGVASLWGHQLFGCKYEKYITLVGTCMMSFAHINNYLLCRHANCDAHVLSTPSSCRGVLKL
ncbi:MAG: MerC domain-containing protein [Zetaproteobacteria bacterium]|nr:MerC domain-containing protein [Zetaproteobacteria bacterium]